jgi:hypothetical protein
MPESNPMPGPETGPRRVPHTRGLPIPKKLEADTAGPAGRAPMRLKVGRIGGLDLVKALDSGLSSQDGELRQIVQGLHLRKAHTVRIKLFAIVGRVRVGTAEKRPHAPLLKRPEAVGAVPLASAQPREMP